MGPGPLRHMHSNPDPQGSQPIKSRPTEALLRLLIDGHSAASLTGISARTLHRLAERGEAPRPVRVGRSVRWRRQELEDWIEGGCQPTRDAGRRVR